MIRSAIVALVLALLSTQTPAHAQQLPRGDAAKLGFSTERLARIGAVFQVHVDAGRLAGAQAMIVRRGEIAYHESWGFRDLEARDPLEADDLFHICSMTKPITSVAVMMLWEEGRFALAEPVARYIPAFAGAQVAKLDPGASTANLQTERPRRPMTIQDLLRHTSGLTYGLFSNTPVDSLYTRANLFGSANLETMVNRLGEIPLIAHPGSRWIYSMSTDVLGRLVEVVSGTPFDEFLRTRLFGPLGMRDTHFRVPAAKLDRTSRGYRHEGATLTLTANTGAGACSPATVLSGGAGLASTAHDYARFTQMLLNGGELDGVRILGRKTVELMTTDHLGETAGPGAGNGFGLGFAVKESPNSLPTSIGTYMWEGLYGTGFWIDPAEDLIGIFMVQIYPNRSIDFKTQFQQLVYQAIVQ
ncbi:MAG: beta-lactamase family protein [Gemmatimonadetes bacterium]|nr:beta-lactamase family protein [Gemmatimonadota bacterium]